MTQTFVESCVDFEVTHLSEFMVQKLPYPETPTLIGLIDLPYLGRRGALATFVHGLLKIKFGIIEYCIYMPKLLKG